MQKEPVTRKSIFRKLAIFLAILGPGIITGSVDNDAGGITTYSLAGAIYGYGLIWTLIPSFIVLVIIQEMNARMGIVTGKGLADLIRENAGVKVTFFIFLGLLFSGIGNTTTEFAGVAGSMEVFGVSKYISVPVVAVLVWVLVVKGTYKIAERIFLIFSVSLLTYVVSAIMAKPDWSAIGSSIIRPKMEISTQSLAMVIGLVGTTIAPWMQFYMQSSVIEKGLKIQNYSYTVADIVVGCIVTVVVAFFIMVACASTLHPAGIEINEAKDAALSLKPLAGNLASQVFAFGLFIASIFSATILPLATAFFVCEAFGFEAGIDKEWDEAKEFYILYTGILVISAIVILIPGAPLIKISLWSQVINGILLPVVLISMMILINKKKIMGIYTNKTSANVIGVRFSSWYAFRLRFLSCRFSTGEKARNSLYLCFKRLGWVFTSIRKEYHMKCERHPWHSINPGPEAPQFVRSIIEIPKGSKGKYELDKESGLLRLDRVLFSSVHYPANYGFIPQTYCDDHDPLDILVICSIDVFAMSIIEAKVIGAMEMVDSEERDDKIIAVARNDMSVNYINDISELPPHTLVELKRFFEDYKQLEHKNVIVDQFMGREKAYEIILEGMKLYNENREKLIRSH
jgi:NRAMP (natural resistance-associated macrophage protein)-like metal ion transporter